MAYIIFILIGIVFSSISLAFLMFVFLGMRKLIADEINSRWQRVLLMTANLIMCHGYVFIVLYLLHSDGINIDIFAIAISAIFSYPAISMIFVIFVNELLNIKREVCKDHSANKRNDGGKRSEESKYYKKISDCFRRINTRCRIRKYNRSQYRNNFSETGRYRAMGAMSKRFLHKIFPSLLLGSFISFSGASYTYAAGIPVLDVSNLGQTTMTAIEAVKQTAKQIQQYALQIQQYENMVKNTLAPAAYVWSEVERMQNKMFSIQDQYNYYKNGGVEQYLNRFGNVNYYRSSENFNLDMFLQNRAEAIDSSKKANDSLAKTIDQQRSDLRKEAADLQSLQLQVQGYSGQMQAAQGTNMLLAQQNNQLLQLRGTLLTQAQAINAQMIQENSKDAMREAWREKIVGKELAKTNGHKGW